MPFFKFVLVLLLISSLFVSCNKRNNDQKKIDELTSGKYSFNISSSESNIDWGSLIDSFSVIPLENKIEALLGKIDKVEIRENKLFLLDVMHRKLNVFDSKNGKFLGQIGTRGKGRGEFLDIRDFSIVGDTIFCLDYNRVNKYHLNSFEFISSVPLTNEEVIDVNPINFVFFGDNNYYIWNNLEKGSKKDDQGYFLLRFENNKKTKSYFKHNEARFFEDKMFFKTTVKNEYLVAPPIGYNNISLLSDTGVINYIDMDFNGKNLPKDYLESIKGDKDYFNLLLANSYYKIYKNIIDIDRSKLYFNIIGPEGYLYEGLLNLKSKEHQFNRIDLDANPLFTNYQDGYLYGYYDALYANKLLKRVPEEKQSKFVKGLKKVNPGEEDNFIFFKMKLKP